MAKLNPAELMEKMQQLIDASEGIEYGYLHMEIEQGRVTTVDGYKRNRTLHNGRPTEKRPDKP